MSGSQNIFPFYEIIGVFICLLASAFFSAAETTLIHLPETSARRLIDTDPEKYGILTFWLESKRRVLSVLLVGNTLVNILCSVLGYQIALYFLPHYAEAFSVFATTIIVLIFGEITPKTLALQYSQSLAVPFLRLVWVIDKIFFLVAAPLSRIPDLILNKKGKTIDSPAITEDEIEYQIRLGYDHSVFEEEARGDLLFSAVEFSEITVKEAMVPRTGIFGLEASTTIEEAVKAIIKSAHSRIPAYRNSLDNIIGLLHAKDLFENLPNCQETTQRTIESIVRKPLLFAPETQKVNKLLAKMKNKSQHMAIVVDEFGGTSGLITLEDIIEELVGDIRDEFDSDDATIHQIDARTWIVHAGVSISDLEDTTGIKLPSSSDYESIGGFVIAKHGGIPAVGTVIESQGIQAKVIVSDARHVERVEIRTLSQDDPVKKQ